MTSGVSDVETTRENRLRDRVKELPADRQKQFYRQFNQQVRDPDTYAVLNYLLVAGLHHFYLRRWWRGAVNLGLFCLGFWLLIFVSMIAGLAVWLGLLLAELPALFRSEQIVQRYNNNLAEKLLLQPSE